MSARIFISYRREDSADACGRIYDHLVALTGPHAFMPLARGSGRASAQTPQPEWREEHRRMHRQPQWTQEFHDALLTHCFALTHGKALVIAIVALADSRTPKYLGHVRGLFHADLLEDRYYLGNRQDGQWTIEPCPDALVKGASPLLMSTSLSLLGR